MNGLLECRQGETNKQTETTKKHLQNWLTDDPPLIKCNLSPWICSLDDLESVLRFLHYPFEVESKKKLNYDFFFF